MSLVSAGLVRATVKRASGGFARAGLAGCRKLAVPKREE
jgi:hypothetical protein